MSKTKASSSLAASRVVGLFQHQVLEFPD